MAYQRSSSKSAVSGERGLHKWPYCMTSRDNPTEMTCVSLTVRFMGLRENAPEAERDFAEMSARVREGKPVYGETELSDYMQAVAARNSTWSIMKFSTIPWYVSDIIVCRLISLLILDGVVIIQVQLGQPQLPRC